jgi:TDG/mug DNA glycosylase family protein
VPKSKSSGATSRAEVSSGGDTPLLRGFPPLARPDARLLVVGSMPGAASLAATEYYAHPRNAFWPIMAALLGATASGPYGERVELLLGHRIALWDVVACCRRTGSLDAAIEPGSVVVNDFATFFAQHAGVAAVFCNGAAALALYRRLVLPTLPPEASALPVSGLPSTSPAHATRGFSAKLAAWRALAPALDAG